MKLLQFKFHDGGRANAGYKGFTGDCAVRAIAIASEEDYQYCYDRLFEIQKEYLSRKRSKKYQGKSASPRNGVYRKCLNQLIEELGGKWVVCMEIGTGCQVHMNADELPKGVIICRLSRHYSTVIDHTIYDTYDPSRGGTRCVYGYWQFPFIKAKHSLMSWKTFNNQTDES